MTQVFDAQGKLIPVTVIKVEDNVVIANRTDDKNGYSAAVVANERDFDKAMLKNFKTCAGMDYFEIGYRK